jgi:predicted DsbA family dithiol-disulfide isomerase
MHIGKTLKAYVEREWPKKSEFCRKVEISPQLLNAYFKSADVRHSTLTSMALKLGMEVEGFMSILKQFEVQNGSEGNQAGLVDANQ